MRGLLIHPLGHAGIGIAGHDGHGPLVVARTLRRVPGRGVAGAVIDEVQVGVVGIPAPGGAAADLPLVAFPALDRAVGAHGLAEHHGLFRIDQHLGVGAGGIGAPDLLARLHVIGGDMAAHAELAARDADEELVLDRQHGRGVGLALGRVAVLHGPFHLAALRVEGHDGRIGLMQEDHAIGIGHAAVDRVAAHHADDVGVLLRLVAPQDLAVIGQIERIDVVREGRVDIHDAVHDEGRALVAPQHAGREGPGDLKLAHVLAGDLVQLGIAGVGIVAGLDRPLLRIVGRLEDRVVGKRPAQTRAIGSLRDPSSASSLAPPDVDFLKLARDLHRSRLPPRSCRPVTEPHATARRFEASTLPVPL